MKSIFTVSAAAHSHRRWFAFAAAVVLAVSGLASAGALTATPAAAATPTEVTSGNYAVSPLVDYPDSSTPLSLLTTSDGNIVTNDITLRIGSDREQALPGDDAYGWLGNAGDPGWVTGDLFTESGVVSFNPEFDSVDSGQLEAGDTEQVLGLDEVSGPGTFSWYQVGLASGTTGASPPLADGYRLGTGTQRDGAAQRPTFTVPPDAGTTFSSDMVGRFSDEGMYCITYSYSAHPASASTRLTATDTLRFAVGDSVATDAPCGSTGGGGSTPPPGGGTTPPGGGTTPPPSDPNSGVGPTGNAIWADGHVDAIHPMIDTADNGTQTLRLRSHDTQTRDWDDVVFYSSDIIKKNLPSVNTRDADYSFAGAPGQAVWNSPQDPIAGAPWVGLSTEDDTLVPLGSTPFQIRLDAVTGPGEQAAPGDATIWVDGAEHGATPNLYASTRTGLPAGWRVSRNTHAHFNWTFTNPGVYCLAFSVETTMSDGTRQTDRQQLTMAVGSSIDPKTVTPCGLSQPYPAPPAAGKSFVADTSKAPVLIEDEATTFTPRLNGEKLDVGLRREDPFLSKPGTTTDIDDAIVHVPFGARPPYEINSDLFHRGTSNQFAWDTTGVSRTAVRGDITWSLDDLRGPGGVAMMEYADAGQPMIDTIDANVHARKLWPASQAISSVWNVSRPGKYCLGMTWSATLTSGQQVSDHHVLTLVVDGPLDPTNYGFNSDPNGAEFVTDGPSFTHDTDTLTKTCAQGGKPTSPDEVPVDGGGTTTPPGSGGSTPPVSSGRDVLKIGHMDVMSTVTEGAKASGTTASGNTLAVTVHDDNTSPATIHDPDKSTFYAAPGSETHIPSDPTYTFLGASGKPVWILPQTQDPALLWPGWNVDLAKATTTTDVQWTLDSVKGPGDFALFENTGFGQVKVLLDSNDATHKAFSYHEHAHANWAFSADGVYCLNSTFAALPTGVGAAQNTTLLMAVGNLDPSLVTPADCGKTAAQVRAQSNDPGNGSSTSPAGGAGSSDVGASDSDDDAAPAGAGVVAEPGDGGGAGDTGGAGVGGQHDASGSGSNLASTGVRVAGISLLGLALVVGGAGLAFAARRRRAAHR